MIKRWILKLLGLSDLAENIATLSIRLVVLEREAKTVSGPPFIFLCERG